MLAALKSLMKDSVVYGIANSIQKLTPVIIIPVVIAHLGDNALKLYDLSFIYVYLFSTLIILGMDSAASVFYFDNKRTQFSKKQVVSYAFLVQVVLALFYGLLFYPFRYAIAAVIFPNDSGLEKYWVMALTIIPGYILFNYGLSVLLWQRQRRKYVGLCILHTVFNIGSVYAIIVLQNGSTEQFFWGLIGSMTLCGLAALFMIRKDIFINPFPLQWNLVEKLVGFGAAFALTSFFRQVIPSVDRYFLLRFGFDAALPQYILAVKLGAFINIGFAAFMLAFTPYSLNKLNHDDAEKEISSIFAFVSIGALTLVPVILLFKDGIINFFADSSYSISTQLLPLFLFGWAFELFTNFALLGVYRIQRSGFILTLLLIGTVIICLLDIALIPHYGIWGAAASFLITKITTFLIAFFYLKKHFHIRVKIEKLLLLFVVAAGYSYLVFILPLLVYAVIVAALVAVVSFYLYELYKKQQPGSVALE